MKDTLAKLIRAAAKAHPTALFGPENIRPQTDYNPVPPAGSTPHKIDMHPDAVNKREKAARNSLLVPAVIIAGVFLILVIPSLINS